MIGMKRWRRRPSAGPTRGAEFVMAEAAISWQPLGAASADPLWPCSLLPGGTRGPPAGPNPAKRGENGREALGTCSRARTKRVQKLCTSNTCGTQNLVCRGLVVFEYRQMMMIYRTRYCESSLRGSTNGRQRTRSPGCRGSVEKRFAAKKVKIDMEHF